MYAVIRAGGRQLRVQEGDVVRIDRVSAEAGQPVVFDEVMLIGEGDETRVGTPTVDGASVRGTVLRQERGAKLLVYTFKRRKNSNRKRRGHRADFTAVKIDAIEG